VTDAPVPPPEAPPAPEGGRARLRWFRARSEVIWLVLVALAVRAAAAWASPAILNDSVSLLGSAERIGKGGLEAWAQGPDHPLLPWLISLFAGTWDEETVATSICVFSGALAVWPLHVLARHASGRHAATAACIVYAALPKAVGVSSVPLTSAAFLPLFLSGLSLVLTASVPSSKRRRLFRLLGAGLLCALAYLCRPEGLVAAGGAALGALLFVPRGRKFAGAGIVALAFVLVAAPYAVALSRDAGHLTLSPKKDVVRFVGAADAPLESNITREAAQDAASALEGALTAPLLLLVLVGVFLPGRWRNPRSRRTRLFVLLTAAVVIALVIRLQLGWGYGGARHLLPAAVLLLPFAGEGFLFLGAFLSRTIARRRLAVVLAAFLAVPYAVKCVLRPEGEEQSDARALGERLAAQARDAHATNVVVATFREPLVAYYARRSLRDVGGEARDVRLWGRFGPLYTNVDSSQDRAALAAALRADGAQWLVLDLFRTATSASGATIVPGRMLAERLASDGVIGTPVVSAGSPLTAFPVR
jgi:hypothetical protein